LSCRFTTGAFGLADADRRHVKLPRIGLVRTHESTRKLARHVEQSRARIRSATVSHRAGRWFCSFSVEVERHDRAPARPDSVAGVDLGVKSLAVLSTGEVIANPRHLEVAQRELRRLQRQACRRVGPDKRTRQQPSQRWRKTQARVARLHTAVANARRDGLHKVTTRLVREHGTIVTREPQRHRDAEKPAPRPPYRRGRHGRTPTPDRVQNGPPLPNANLYGTIDIDMGRRLDLGLAA
jgi:putative transposase